jgi:ribosome recycling factor
VEAYGSKMPLNQVASLSVPEPSLIVVQPFDPGLMSAIERASASRTSASTRHRRQGDARADSHR